MATEYIPIKDRVRVRRLADAEYAYAVEVMANANDYWRCVGTRPSEYLAQVFADAVRAVLCFTCEAVRERCVEAAVATIRSAAGDTLEQTADEVDAAIRELKL